MAHFNFNTHCRRWLESMLIALAIAGHAVLTGQAQDREESDVEIISGAGLKLPETIPDLNLVAQGILQLTNEFRKAEQLPETKSNPELTETSAAFATYMSTHDKYGHTADGHRPSERAKQHGYDFCIVLENIAYHYRSTGYAAEELAKGFVGGWKASPIHRQNMLDPDISQTGVSVAYSKKTGHFYAVQMFGRPLSDAIRFQIANPSERTVYYQLGEKDFILEPRYTRTHEQCRPTELKFLGTESKSPTPKSVLRPRQGDSLAVVNSDGEPVLKRQSAESP